jgi:tetratricopeptide (TPR) repeat protein
MPLKHISIVAFLTLVFSPVTMAQDAVGAEAHFSRAEAFLQSEKYDEAIAELRRAIRLKPEWPEAHFKLGVAYYSISPPKETDFAWGFGNKGDPGKNSTAALEAFEEAVRLKPDWPEALNYLGAYYRGFQADDKAVRVLKDAVRLRPEFIEAQENLAMAYLYAGRYEHAIEHLHKTISMNPALPRPYKLLGLTYLTLGDKKKASEQYKMLQTLDQEMANDLKQWLESSSKPYVGVQHVLNFRLISIHMIYPPHLRNARTEGQVTIEVIVDEAGKVVSARALAGPGALREAGENAARTARFRPVKVLGAAVTVKGIVVVAYR